MDSVKLSRLHEKVDRVAGVSPSATTRVILLDLMAILDFSFCETSPLHLSALGYRVEVETNKIAIRVNPTP